MLLTTGDAQHRWWSCCWGHIFEHDPVAEDEELRCPAFVDDEEPCGTYFVFEPFASRQESRGRSQVRYGTARPRWAIPAESAARPSEQREGYLISLRARPGRPG